jgi:hypothetical protein
MATSICFKKNYAILCRHSCFWQVLYVFPLTIVACVKRTLATLCGSTAFSWVRDSILLNSRQLCFYTCSEEYKGFREGNREIWGFQGCDAEDSGSPGCDAVPLGVWWPTFRRWCCPRVWVVGIVFLAKPRTSDHTYRRISWVSASQRFFFHPFSIPHSCWHTNRNCVRVFILCSWGVLGRCLLCGTWH